MATDGSELTFIRCPACRSLVPAVSSRCRMCGATLDSLDQAEEPQAEDLQKSGRVRQRTMSKPNDVLSQTASELRDEGGGGDSTESAEDAFEDPLQDYVEEVAVDAPSDAITAKSDGELATPSVDNAAEVVVESGTKAKTRRGAGLFGEPKAGAERKQRAKTVDLKPSDIEADSGFSSQVADTSKERPGSARDKTREKRPDSRDESSGEAQRSRSRKETRSDDEQQRASESVTREEEPSRKRRKRKKKKRGVDTDVVRELRDDGVEPVSRKSTDEVVFEKPEDMPGRLFGWLVSYGDPCGQAIELREGQYFVSKDRLKESDLLLDDQSVSTPHCVLRVGVDTGFEAQDLMSERGVFVRSRDSDVYRREHDRVTIEHGDWLRFGDVEFLVSLIAYPGKE